mmetsp:Transcript_64255/g.178475  ORF Transcript_64255/g.178475 Transcript_64255/m.178475 type:complete len:304 (-) Transcript_64255:2474-3385(-)
MRAWRIVMKATMIATTANVPEAVASGTKTTAEAIKAPDAMGRTIGEMARMTGVKTIGSVDVEAAATEVAKMTRGSEERAAAGIESGNVTVTGLETGTATGTGIGVPGVRVVAVVQAPARRSHVEAVPEAIVEEVGEDRERGRTAVATIEAAGGKKMTKGGLARMGLGAATTTEATAGGTNPGVEGTTTGTAAGEMTRSAATTIGMTRSAGTTVGTTTVRRSAKMTMARKKTAKTKGTGETIRLSATSLRSVTSPASVGIRQEEIDHRKGRSLQNGTSRPKGTGQQRRTSRRSGKGRRSAGSRA